MKAIRLSQAAGGGGNGKPRLEKAKNEVPRDPGSEEHKKAAEA